MTDNEITAMALDPDGNLWCGTAAGLSYFDGVSWKELQIEYELSKYQPSKLYINSIAFTPEGIMWVNIIEKRFDGQGLSARLSRFDGNEWITYTENDGLPSLGVNAIAVDGDGTVWAGLGYGGVSWFDGEVWTYYNLGDGGHVYSIAINPNGEVWVGTWGGLLQFDGTVWKKYTQADGLPYNWVMSTAIDFDGKVWFGTYHYGDEQAGLSCFDGTTVRTCTTADGLIHNYAQSIAIDNENNVWIGTWEGVSRFDGQTWTNFTTNDDWASNHVSSIVFDNDGKLWIGTFNGVFRLNM